LRKNPRDLSDHNPLLLCTDWDEKKVNRPFCFENSWIRHQDFLPKVKEIWDKQVLAKNAVEVWNIKTKRVKKWLKGWGLSLKGHNRKYKKILQEELLILEQTEEDHMLSSSALERKSFIQREMMRILEEEEQYWHKRTNLRWPLEGDNNSEFFHRVANGKKRKNTIFSMEGEEQELLDTEKILEHATNYYKTIFGPSEKSSFTLSSSLWGPNSCVSQEENHNLVAPFTQEEIKKVVFSMDKNTAPGPDHLPIEFFQPCWGVINVELEDMFKEFQNNELELERLNYGVITLLPQIKEANKIHQYRPICLLNVIYKIFTKALMLRLEPVMSNIIDKCQSGFIKGRNIVEGIMSLHEILHDTKVRKKDGLVLKLDFEKAYDKISWNFLFECLKQRGFCEKWCHWIEKVVTCGTLSVKVNDKVGAYFKCGKGVRQGALCLLSYLTLQLILWPKW
jgi:hypothetical protein